MKRLGRLFAWLERGLARPLAPALILFLAAALSLPTLGAGATSDDHIRHVVQQGSPVALGSAPFDLFNFVSGRPEDNERMMAQGVLPWWADQEARIHFCRPLSGLTHALDHAVAPGNTVLEHAHNLLWYVLAVAALWLLLRRTGLPRWLAGLALLLYAIDDGNATAIGWVASRNALLAATFAFLTVWAHDRWRRGAWSAGAVLAPLLFVLAMASGEAGVGAFGYLVAHVVCLERSKRRFLVLVPYAAVLAGFATIYALGDFGSRHSTHYIDPAGEPLRFVAAVVTRLPVLLHAALGGLPADGWIGYPMIHPVLPAVVWVLASLSVALFVWLSRPIWQDDAEARFWLVGALLACVPACAGIASNRLLVLASAGIFVVMAQLIVYLVRAGGPGRLGRAVAAALVLGNLLFPFLFTPLTPQIGPASGPNRALARADASLLEQPIRGDETVVVLNPPFEPMVYYATFARLNRGLTPPAAWRVLASGSHPLVVERVDERSLRLTAPAGLLVRNTDMMMRSPGRDLQVGARVELPGMSVEIEAVTADGRPARALYRFAEPLEEPRYRWLQWEGRGFVAFVPPAVGQRISLAPIDLFKLFGDG